MKEMVVDKRRGCRHFAGGEENAGFFHALTPIGSVCIVVYLCLNRAAPPWGGGRSRSYVAVRDDRRLAVLREQLAHWESAHRCGVERAAVISSGQAELDRCLPAGGLRGHELIEWFALRRVWCGDVGVVGCGRRVAGAKRSIAARVGGDRSPADVLSAGRGSSRYRFAASGRRATLATTRNAFGPGIRRCGRRSWVRCGAGCLGSTRGIFAAFN